jgi:murein L,D-transpeptidase YafK
MNVRRALLALVPAVLLTAHTSLGEVATSDAVTEVRVDKSDHKLELWAGKKLLKTYKVAVGAGGLGGKQYEGDMKTPVGTYTIFARQTAPFHRFLNVSYPNAEDKKRFAELAKKGEVPKGRGIGGEIGVHGVGTKALNGIHKKTDWTAGCIALDDAEIDEVAKLVPNGTKLVVTD